MLTAMKYETRVPTAAVSCDAVTKMFLKLDPFISHKQSDNSGPPAPTTHKAGPFGDFENEQVFTCPSLVGIAIESMNSDNAKISVSHYHRFTRAIPTLKSSPISQHYPSHRAIIRTIPVSLHQHFPRPLASVHSRPRRTPCFRFSCERSDPLEPLDETTKVVRL